MPPVSDAYGAFGFANATGSEIIVVHDMQQPGALRRAICGGRVLPIRFSRRQKGSGATRESRFEFDRLEGTVFRVLEQRANPEDTCFVATASLLEGSALLRVVPSSSPATCTLEEQRRLAGFRERRIKRCWSLAAFQRQGVIGIVEYERAGRDALASLIVVANDRGTLIDFPAEVRGGRRRRLESG